MDIEDTKQVWVAWTNTDCIAARGFKIPKAVCEVQATAIRLGREGGFRGSDCNVTEETAVRIGGKWLVPGMILHPSKEDTAAQKKADARADALQRAKAAGVTDDDLRQLG